MKALTFQLDGFGRDALEEFVRGQRHSRSAAVRIASLYYLADRESERSSWRAPGCARASRDAADVAVRLDRETWQALQAEAERQDVSAADLTRHAVLYFLADVDSGRVGDKLESALKEHDTDS
jgi:predicted DNA-binding ribbon-helix-helix protein